jgi:hypothetical protein
MSTRGRFRVAGILATLLATVSALFGIGGTPASAHSNGRAIVMVRQFTLTPAANGWTAEVVAADFDSGAPLRNTTVTLASVEPGAAAPAAAATGTTTTKTTAAAAAPAPITLAPTSEVGDYRGALTGAKPGMNHLELKIRTTPGWDPVAPFDQIWDVSLVAGQPVKIVGGDSGGGGSNLGLILGVAGGVVGVAVLYGLFAVRRRTAVPAAPAKAKDKAGVR